ncbi:MAG: hypothetical protein CTY12_00950 [Methylotenera sp.]|nr:MAG: hypothetical protein CTY12_00950 [Methylotenera sp.]
MATRQKLQIIFLPSENKPCTKLAIPIMAKMVRDKLYSATALSVHNELERLNTQFDTACTQAQHLLDTKLT